MTEKTTTSNMDPPVPQGPMAIRIEAKGRRTSLGVGHFLVWIAACGVSIAAARQWAPEHMNPYAALALLAYSAVRGSAWAGMAILFHRSIALPTPIPLQPGEWLAMLYSIQMIIECAADAPAVRSVFLYPDNVLLAISCCLFVVPLYGREVNRPWSIFFAILIVSGCATLIGSIVAMMAPTTFASTGPVAQIWRWLPDAAAILGLFAAVYWTRRQSYGWLHGLGVITFGCARILQLILRGWMA